MDYTVYSALLTGIGMSIITEVAKRYGWRAQDILAILMLLAGLFYAAYIYFVGAEERQLVWQFILTAFGSAVGAYEYFWKAAQHKSLD